MNEKISFPDLVGLLSSKMNITKKEAETFLKEFFTVSTEVITSGEELRINGLGLFKPIWVEARGSINVQTGEPVEIPGHYKLSFIPDKVLRNSHPSGPLLPFYRQIQPYSPDSPYRFPAVQPYFPQYLHK